MAKRFKSRRAATYKSREKAVLATSDNVEISQTNRLVCTISKQAVAYNSRSPQPVVLATGEFKDIDNGNRLVVRIT